MNDCPFCRADAAVLANELAFACLDKYPVNAGHLLVVPRRHFASWFDATPAERDALLLLVDAGRAWLDQHHRPDGYNIGINIGEASGQTIPHLHVHLIPRYRGDCANPRGGVRGVIPARQWYPAKDDQP
jgi:diadenosine tetraphosphate (Ap4A) HIT family hydrolase